MYELIGRPASVKVTTKLAQEWACMEGCPSDRPTSQRRLDVYRKEVENGSFRSVVWAKAHCRETNKTYRVNGKHTSLVFALLETPVPPGVFAHIEEYECETLQDVARLYATFDSRMQGRTPGDINATFSAVSPLLGEMSPRLINMAVSGISYGMEGDSYSQTQPIQRAERLLENEEFVLFLAELLTGPNLKMLMRVPVVGAIWKTYQKDKGECKTFWEAVRDETGASPDLPCRRLAKYLAVNAVNNGTGAHAPRNRKATAREFLVKSIHAWNAFRRGAGTNLAYFADKPVPDAV